MRIRCTEGEDIHLVYMHVTCIYYRLHVHMFLIHSPSFLRSQSSHIPWELLCAVHRPSLPAEHQPRSRLHHQPGNWWQPQGYERCLLPGRPPLHQQQRLVTPVSSVFDTLVLGYCVYVHVPNDWLWARLTCTWRMSWRQIWVLLLFLYEMAYMHM